MKSFSHLKALQYLYGPDKQIVEIDLSNGVKVNATEMAKIFGKQPRIFLRKKSVKALIALWKSKLDKSEGTKRPLALLETAFLSNEGESEGTFSEVNQADYDPRILEVRRGGEAGGETWMCRKLAIKFAAWLNPEFEDWLLDILDSLLFGPMGETMSMLGEVAALANERDALLKEVVPNPVQLKVDDLNRQITHLRRRLSKATGQQLNMLRQLETPS